MQDGFDFQRCCQAVEAAGVAGTEGLQKSCLACRARWREEAERERKVTYVQICANGETTHENVFWGAPHLWKQTIIIPLWICVFAMT